MKYTLFISTLFFLYLHLPAQDILHIDSIPVSVSLFEPGTGVVLDKGWRWQKGDAIEWSQPGFNDASWQLINPLLDVHHSLPQIPISTIIWLRIRFSIDSTIQKKQLALLVQQSGASELYLNGTLIERFGTVVSDPDKIKAYDPLYKPILLPVNNNPVQVLAIRYALEKNVHYSTAFAATTNPLLIAKLQYAQDAIENYHRNLMALNNYYFFIIGLFFVLALIHAGYYFFRKAQRANLFFALYALFYIAYILCPIVIDLHSVYSKYYSVTTGLMLIIVVGPLLLTAIYELLDAKKDWLYKAIPVLALITVFIYFWQYDWGWHAGADLMTLIVQIAIIRIILKAIKKKKKGAMLLGAGAVLFLISFSLFVVIAYMRPENYFLIGLLYAIGVLSIPLATAFYLGLEFGILNVSLKQRLDEVSELSQKNISQEKEKQQLLAAQNENLEKQVKERTVELTKSLEELKATQTQLIQSEKMASLGELTAGIAHEIQNPLNFVNNFSEVNKELISELVEEVDKGNTNEVKSLANDIRANEEKINHHGKRADAIVKGMLQHSRQTSGTKEPTDINALCDEYLRLSYHGLRAKDKSLPTGQAGFNATIKTDLDNTIGKISIVPQDIGRVLLNLLNNAFYAVNEKKKNHSDYEPIVTVSTRVSLSPGEGRAEVQIKIEDNGNGIPQNIISKIFQPFFTTKPTGQGTGLGLSLSYDIIKAHGGELKAETKDGEGLPAGQAGTSFIITLPVL